MNAVRRAGRAIVALPVLTLLVFRDVGRWAARNPSRSGPIVAMLVLVIVAGQLITGALATLHRNQIAGCGRQNQLRRESNDRIPAHTAEARILAEFIRSAEVARLRAATMEPPAGAAADRATARQYGKYRVRLARDVRFHRVPLTDCAKVYRR